MCHFKGIIPSTIVAILLSMGEHAYVVGFDCFKCQGIDDIHNCNTTGACLPSEHCYTETYLNKNRTLVFTLGCRKKELCVGLDQFGRKRRASVAPYPICLQCCTLNNCNKNLCPFRVPSRPVSVNGAWSSWGPWSNCGASCGTGLKSRFRTCDNPPPSQNGHQCLGAAKDVALCQIDCSSITGRPAIYSGDEQAALYSNISIPCTLIGTSIRAPDTFSSLMTTMKSTTQNPTTRPTTQSTTPPSTMVSATPTKTTPVNVTHNITQTVPVNGAWSIWGSWSHCDVSCGIGLKSRFRKCDNPPPSQNGHQCLGDTKDEMICQIACSSFRDYSLVSPRNTTIKPSTQKQTTQSFKKGDITSNNKNNSSIHENKPRKPQ